MSRSTIASTAPRENSFFFIIKYCYQQHSQYSFVFFDKKLSPLTSSFFHLYHLFLPDSQVMTLSLTKSEAEQMRQDANVAAISEDLEVTAFFEQPGPDEEPHGTKKTEHQGKTSDSEEPKNLPGINLYIWIHTLITGFRPCRSNNTRNRCPSRISGELSGSHCSWFCGFDGRNCREECYRRESGASGAGRIGGFYQSLWWNWCRIVCPDWSSD